MKNFNLFILSIFLLTGCSYIQVDEKVTNYEDSTQGIEVSTPSIENILESVDLFDLFERKTLEAKDLNYLALGDSLTRGVGDEYNNYGFTGILAQNWEESEHILSVELDNRGKNGRRSDQLLALLEKGHYDDELEKADVISISIGGNDVMKVVKSDLFNLNASMFEQALPPFVDRYKDIRTYIRKHTDAPILFVGFYNPFSIITDEITPFETIISDWNNEIANIANNTKNACFVPVEDLFTSNQDMVYHTDFFHPNATGYKRMADRIIQTMPNCDLGELNDLLSNEGS